MPRLMGEVNFHYAVMVIGGGHAGAEAAWAAANLVRHDGQRVALVTMDPEKIGTMSCNPAIGGLAKGQMVREIDALGGLMARAIDAAGIQFRILNQSKGPAVQGPRAQADKYRYAHEVQRLLKTRDNLDILAATVDQLLVHDGRIQGLVANGQTLRAPAIVLTTGTFMRGLMHTGTKQTPGGRAQEAPALGISDQLRKLGFELGRLKTGTPPRLDGRTLDLDALELQPGDVVPTPFSDRTTLTDFPALEQRPCWITHTNQASHQLIRDNLERAPLYNGQIGSDSTGPRYCPSIEDKVVRFADRNAHHVFLEPESLSTDEIYCNGISTSLPGDVQEKIVHNLPGCERATILRYGYAVEYDMVWPHQIDATTMTKSVAGLFLAGQINGTSGYEEAAAQGLLAGLNAARYGRDQDMVRLRRDQAYLGVLMDDLVTKTPREPYRMFTSRAEHRLLLRADNADTRLTLLGRALGLVGDARWQAYESRVHARDQLQIFLQNLGDPAWLRQPGRTHQDVLEKLNGSELPALSRSRRVMGTLLADTLYAGYIDRHRREVDKLASQEALALDVRLDYTTLSGLRNEAAATLNHFQPATLGQAGRLAGVTPADLMVVRIAMSRVQNV